MKNITIKSKLTLSDFRNYNLSHIFFWKNPFSKYIFLLIILISLFLTFNLYLGKITNRYIHFITMFLPFVILIIILQFIFNTKIIFRGNKFLKEEQSFKISDKNFSCKSKTVDFNTPWEKLYQICESEKIFAFYISKLQAFILPKRYLTNEEIDHIKTIIKTNFNKKKLHLKKK